MTGFKTNTTKNYNKPTGIKYMYGSSKKPRNLKIQKQSEDYIILKKYFLTKKRK